MTLVRWDDYVNQKCTLELFSRAAFAIRVCCVTTCDKCQVSNPTPRVGGIATIICLDFSDNDTRKEICSCFQKNMTLTKIVSELSGDYFNMFQWLLPPAVESWVMHDCQYNCLSFMFAKMIDWMFLSAVERTNERIAFDCVLSNRNLKVCIHAWPANTTEHWKSIKVMGTSTLVYSKQKRDARE